MEVTTVISMDLVNSANGCRDIGHSKVYEALHNMLVSMYCYRNILRILQVISPPVHWGKTRFHDKVFSSDTVNYEFG